MAQNYKIAIIGNKDTILGFKALGLHTFDANNPKEAEKILLKIKSEQKSEESEEEEKKRKGQNYAIIFITEDLAKEIDQEIYKKLSQDVLPAIIPVPGITGSSNYGIKRIGKMVEQAVGSDIFGDK